MLSSFSLSNIDPEIYSIIEKEKKRQKNHVELIASENFTLPAILEATGSILTNKYAEGYPNKRYYGGCSFIDSLEEIAINRAIKLFGADHANVQPHSGSQANIAVYTAILKPKDKILAMSLEHGGHLTHGHPKNLTGILYNVVHYGVDRNSEKIDYTTLAEIAYKEKPKIITVGASAYSRVIDFKQISAIAKECGSYMLADIAHIAGLIAANEHPSPIKYADFVTTTTHKSLRGPRGGLILCKKKFANLIDNSVFPGNQGGPLMHIVAAKAVCFSEALKPEFIKYQKQVKSNAAYLAQEVIKQGLKVVSKGTDNHLFLIDLRPSHKELTGRKAQDILDTGNITLNCNTVPFETRRPFETSGLRIGSLAVTSRGMKRQEMKVIAKAIIQILNNSNNKNIINKVRSSIIELCNSYPLPY